MFCSTARHPPIRSLVSLLTELRLTLYFYKLLGMAMPPPVRHRLPVDVHVYVTDIVDVEAKTTYYRCTITIWV